MKILVFDDTLKHRNAAIAQLGVEHELTVAGTYDEAQLLLAGGYKDYQKIEPVRFEAVLVDLLVPASAQQLGGDACRFFGQEMPIGIFIALLGAVKSGAKYVAILTDSNHHQHPASACVDSFNEDNRNPTPFNIEQCKVILSNTGAWVGSDGKNWKDLLDYLVNGKKEVVRTDSQFRIVGE